MPRHPPCALNNLATKMLASTVQFSKYGQDHAVDSPRTQNPPEGRACGRPVQRRPMNPLTSRATHNNQGARSLRTQQCAEKPTPSPTTTFHAPTREAVLARPVPRPTTRCQRSTQLSNHPGNLARRATSGPGAGPGQPPPPPTTRAGVTAAARCSLERR